MADKRQRPIAVWRLTQGSILVRSVAAGAVYVSYADYKKLKTEVASLHADIIEQGRKVQIAASGESKYGAMSDSEFIEWMLGKLEGK